MVRITAWEAWTWNHVWNSSTSNFFFFFWILNSTRTMNKRSSLIYLFTQSIHSVSWNISTLHQAQYFSSTGFFQSVGVWRRPLMHPLSWTWSPTKTSIQFIILHSHGFIIKIRVRLLRIFKKKKKNHIISHNLPKQKNEQSFFFIRFDFGMWFNVLLRIKIRR